MSIHQTVTSNGQRMSLEQLIKTAERLQANGSEDEAVNLYRQWISQSRDENKFVALFNYGWLLQKLNKFSEAANAQDEFLHQYADFLSGGRAAIH
jgi:tetratricopeptide (TPR) repeat protein